MSQPIAVAKVTSGDTSASAKVFIDYLVSEPDGWNLKMVDGVVYVREGHHFGLSGQVYPVSGKASVRKSLSEKLAKEIVRIRKEVADSLSASPVVSA